METKSKVIFCFRSQGNACGSRFEFAQTTLNFTGPFRKNQDRSFGFQVIITPLKRHSVELCGREENVGSILFTVNGNNVKVLEEGTGKSVENAAVGNKRHPLAHQSSYNERVHEGIGVIDGQDQRPFGGAQFFESVDLKSSEKDSERYPDNEFEKRV